MGPFQTEPEAEVARIWYRVEQQEANLKRPPPRRSEQQKVARRTKKTAALCRDFAMDLFLERSGFPDFFCVFSSPLRDSFSLLPRLYSSSLGLFLKVQMVSSLCESALCLKFAPNLF